MVCYLFRLVSDHHSSLSSVRGGRSTEGGPKGLHVLVVDDSNINRKMLVKSLHSLKFTAEEVDSSFLLIISLFSQSDITLSYETFLTFDCIRNSDVNFFICLGV